MRGQIQPSFEAVPTAEERIEALVRVTQQGFAESEHLGRAIIRATVSRPSDGDGRPRRGYRRVEWIETGARADARDGPAERFERLVSALTLLVGWESMIVLQDTRGLDAAEAEDVCVWAARTLLAAAGG